ncbi:Retinoblastoma-binding protein [Coemansia sp. RSA 988]|nr:Retinoblastoma-binding protein [Coemansia sp. RSA 988]
MSQIQYRFRSTKDYSTIVFDGLSISVIDLKQEILRDQKLNPNDFDLVVTNEQTNEDYKDDMALIPKSTVVLARRIPYTGPKMSRVAPANNYRQPTAGYGTPQFGNGSQRIPGTQAGGAANPFGYRGPQSVGMGAGKSGDVSEQDEQISAEVAQDPEDARIAAMLQQSDDQWMHQQSIMEMYVRELCNHVFRQRLPFQARFQCAVAVGQAAKPHLQRPLHPGRGGFRPRPHLMRPEHKEPPPPNYVCHRCGIQGHWIEFCPSLNQPNDGTGRTHMHRVKRTTGIPKSFLQKVDNLDDVGNALVTSDGTLVVATANKAAWDSAQRLSRNAIANGEAIDPSEVPNSLKCNICKDLVHDAVTTPCCKTVFCSGCIEKQLLEPGDMRFTCPACNTKDVVPDQLEVASEVRGKVEEFLREYSERKNAAAVAAAAAAAAAGSATTATSNSGEGEKADNGSASNTVADNTVTVASIDTTTSSAVMRPPVQMAPRPRYNMNTMSQRMMMGMGGGFPGMVGMPMPMGQMPPFMPPARMMPPPGMMPPGMWNGNMPHPGAIPMRPPMVPTSGATQSQQQSADSQSCGSHSRQTSRSRSSSPRRPRRASRRRRSRHRAHSRDIDNDVNMIDIDSAPNSRSRRMSNEEEQPTDYQPPPLEHSSKSARTRDSSRSPRGHSKESRSRRDHDRARESGRSSRRDGDRGSRSHRSESRRRKDGSDRGRSRSRIRDDDRHYSGQSGRRADRSRSPVGGRRSSRRRRGRGEADGENSKSAELSIRGQSESTATDGKTSRNISDRLSDNRPATEDDRQKPRRSNGGRRRRNRRR